jgi:hypothetical protein
LYETLARLAMGTASFGGTFMRRAGASIERRVDLYARHGRFVKRM